MPVVSGRVYTSSHGVSKQFWGGSCLTPPIFLGCAVLFDAWHGKCSIHIWCAQVVMFHGIKTVLILRQKPDLDDFEQSKFNLLQ